jgi:hypothetical protein
MSRPDLRSEYAHKRIETNAASNPLGAPIVYPEGHDRDWELQEARDGTNTENANWEFDEMMGGEW